MSNRNKRSKCIVCEKWLRADTLQRHSKTHKDLLSLPDEEMKEELRSRHDVQVAQEVKRQKVVETAQSLGLSVPEEYKGLKKPENDRARCKDVVVRTIC